MDNSPAIGSPATDNIVKVEGGSNNDAVKMITIKIEKQNTKTVAFKIKRNVHLGKVLIRYCEHMGFTENVYKFQYLGKQVKDTDTPDSLDMEDDDVIDCWDPLLGGFSNA
ncbi:uncharacterized protein LOC141612922 [Silene latifolia]|uniref:uncharacterized protein LOC141612922 n=1 Tax=Silene latifolia TaxID=37657 RepID=UPI003D76A6EA